MIRRHYEFEVFNDKGVFSLRKGDVELILSLDDIYCLEWDLLSYLDSSGRGHICPQYKDGVVSYEVNRAYNCIDCRIACRSRFRLWAWIKSCCRFFCRNSSIYADCDVGNACKRSCAVRCKNGKQYKLSQRLRPAKKKLFE